MGPIGWNETSKRPDEFNQTFLSVLTSQSISDENHLKPFGQSNQFPRPILWTQKQVAPHSLKCAEVRNPKHTWIQAQAQTQT